MLYTELKKTIKTVLFNKFEFCSIRLHVYRKREFRGRGKWGNHEHLKENVNKTAKL